MSARAKEERVVHSALGTFMLNYHLWYAGIWSVILGLYSLRLSKFSVPLPLDLTFFFVITILTSVAVGLTSLSRKPSYTSLTTIEFGSTRRPVIVSLLTVGFLADWAYQGSIPIFSEGGYQGYDPTSAVQQTIGIPIVHVALISVTVSYAIYLGYFLCVRPSRSAAIAYGSCVALLVVNQGRGYVVFVLFTLLIAAVTRGAKGEMLRRWPSLRRMSFGVLGLVSTAVFVGAYGNLRLGSAWYDSSSFKYIAGLSDVGEPHWLDIFSWVYTYLTSPLANLAYASANAPAYSSVGLLATFVPETFTKGLLVATPIGDSVIVLYLNAGTGFFQAQSQYGVAGLYASYLGTMILLGVWTRLLASRDQGCSDLGRIVAVLFIVVQAFYNPFSTAALAYVPLTILLAVIVAARRGVLIYGYWYHSLGGNELGRR